MVYHILKDGSRIDTVKGHVVRMGDAEPVYRLIHSLNTDKAHTYSKDSVK